MPKIRNLATTAVLGAVVAAGAMIATTTPASAYVACNRFGECWHVHQRIVYPRHLGVVFYDDGWRFPHPGYYWRRDRDDRGYWYHNRWRRF